MKRVGLLVGVAFLTAVIYVFCFSYDSTKKPNSYYQVYLDGKVLGTIKSKRELETYIADQGKEIKKNVQNYNEQLEAINVFNNVIGKISLPEEVNNLSNDKKVNYLIKNEEILNISDIKVEKLKYYKENKLYNLSSKDIEQMKEYVSTNEIYLSAETIYSPNGITIKKIATYHNDIEEVSDMYAKIISKKNCTIAGYKFTIKPKDEKEEEKIIYVTDSEIFSDAIDSLAGIFVGTDKYKTYKEQTQNDIVDTGSIIEKVYIDEDVTYKAVNISTNEKIYTNASDLAQNLLYGDKYEEKIITVEDGDSISSIAFNNQISIDEFLISNRDYNSADNLLYAGKQVVIAQTNPQIDIVVETHNVQDMESNFSTIEQYDNNMIKGDEVVTQEGEKGVDRVTQNIKAVNGQINYIETEKKETLKAPTTKIVTVGSKVIPNVGSTRSWGWPTTGGYMITSGYQYRINPVNGSRELHTGLDIAGTGYGSPVYATNNGTIITQTYHYSYGNYIVIDHANGFYTLYAHMSGFVNSLHVGSVVERGQQIGYVGSTGSATGPHLHYEIKTCPGYSCHTDPMRYY